MNARIILNKIQKHCRGYWWLLRSSFTKLDVNQVMFFTFQGQYTCNPRYICEEIQKRDPRIRCIWVLFDGNDGNDMPENVRTVRMGSEEYYHALYSSKIWVDNAFNVVKLPVRKRKNQLLLETMHGSLGIKRIGADSNRTRNRNRKAAKSSRMTDAIISNSDFEDMVYRTSFWKETPILKFGHARSDILVRSTQDAEMETFYKKKVREFYGLSLDVKIALYGPTYMTGGKKNTEMFNSEMCRQALEKRYGGEWVILLRMHPRDIRLCRENIYNSYVLDGNLYRDIQSLMVGIDFAVTDYSSWIFDYILTGKPGVLFAPDLEFYGSTTGFYYPLTDTPYPLVTDNAELAREIEGFMEPEKLKEKIQSFLEDKGCMEDGHASERIADYLMDFLASDMIVNGKWGSV